MLGHKHTHTQCEGDSAGVSSKYSVYCAIVTPVDDRTVAELVCNAVLNQVGHP